MPEPDAVTGDLRRVVRTEPVPPELAGVRRLDRVTVANCAQIADVGERAVRILERWELRRARPVLGDAIRHLRQVAASGSYGAALSDWDRTAAAVCLISDWYHIVASLPQIAGGSLARELAQALARDNGDIRSQLRLGVLLGQAGLQPRVPGGAGRRPDYLVTADGVDLAVEVKTAETEPAVLRAIERAAVQIRDAGLVGIVAIDVSRALGAEQYTTGHYHDAETPTAQFGRRFGTFGADVAHRFGGRGLAEYLAGRGPGTADPGRHSVVSGVILYARTLAWHASDPHHPALVNHTYAGYVGGAYPPEIEAGSRHVREALLGSLNAGSITPPVPLGPVV